MCKRFSILCLTAGVLILALVPDALAANVGEAMDFYNKKDFKHAHQLFQKAVKENPRDWKARYYLGNCFYAMGKYNSAAYHYHVSKGMTRIPQQRRLSQAGLHKAQMTEINERVTLTNIRTAADKSNIGRETQKNQRESQILSQAERQAANVRKQGEDRIQAEKAASQMRSLDWKGEMTLDITQDRAAAIQGEADRQAQDIKDTAKNRVDNMR